MNGLTYIRRQCNLSLSELADTLGVSRQAISSWENGRKSIPEKRKKQLAEFFGVDEKFFGDIGDEEKIELLKKAMYRWDGIGKEALLYRDTLPTSPDGKKLKKIHFSKDRTYTLDEEFADARKRRNLLVEKIGVSIDWSDKTDLKIMDYIVAINRGCALYGTAYDLAEGMKQEKPGLRMPFYYEVMTVLGAMQMALLGKSKSDLSLYDEDDIKWMNSLATEIADHWNEKKRKFGRLAKRTKPIDQGKPEEPKSVEEIERMYSEMFDNDEEYLSHGLDVFIEQ